MTQDRLHLRVAGATRAAAGRSRGVQLRHTLAAAYAKYAELFRRLGISESRESEAVDLSLAAIEKWRPEVVREFEAIADASGATLPHVVALNARTEILALAPRASHECSAVTSKIDGRRFGVQTWDWHVELAEFWHTQEVRGPGFAFVGLTEQGILAKIGVNSAGLALHFNILGHRDDGPRGIPMHVLAAVVLSECASVDEAVAVIRDAPIGSSSAFTMLDSDTAVSVEMSPAGVFAVLERDGSVQRTNHFQVPVPLAGQKSELHEPDSTARLALIRDRLGAGSPADAMGLVALLRSGPGDPPLTCVPDMSLGFGERWATLATAITDPVGRGVRILDGNPTEASTGAWRSLVASGSASPA